MSPLAQALPDTHRHTTHSVRQLGAVCCAYLLLFAVGVLAWLASAEVRLDTRALGACALVPLAGLALLWRDTTDARRYTLHMLAATLACPIALLLWAGSVDSEQLPSPPERPWLDARQLLRGAVDVQDAGLQGGGIVLMRSARFADHTELRLTRFHEAEGAARYLAMLTQAMPAEPFHEAGRQARRLVGPGIGSTFVMLEQHGPDLLELRARDVQSGLARLAAQQVPVPAATHRPATPEPAARWPFFAAMAAAHALVFVALIAWGGSHTTRVPALRGALVATPEQLHARLLSLGRPGGPFEISALAGDGPLTLRVDASPHPRRHHHVTLQIDPLRGSVQVREKLRVNGDAPEDDDEALMDHDAAGPDAQYVASSTWQATMIDPARLADVPLMLHAHHAELPRRHAATLDAEGVLTVLCALVTRSGWHWQPRLWG